MTSQFPPGTQFWTAEWMLPVATPPIHWGFVAAQAGKIVAVGQVQDLPDGLANLPQPGTLLSPGLVNTHTHLEQSYPQMVDKAPKAPFSDWLLAVVAQNREHGSSEDKMMRAVAGCQELLATGTTCVNDLASGSESLQALAQAGLSGFVSLEFFHPAIEPVEITGILAAYQRLKAQSPNRLQVGISPHAPYNVSPNAWKALMDACDPPLIHAHAAESWDETLYFQGEPTSGIPELHQKLLGRTFQPRALAKSPVAYLAQFGLLNDRTILAHAVFTNEADRKLLADFGVTVTHCPRSNLFLQGQTLTAADWTDSGVVMGLGTDGRVSTENLDLRAEARCAMQLHGWIAQKALSMMTLEGAKALHLESKIGSLEAGKSADWVLWKAKQSTLSAEERLMSPDTQVQGVWTQGECRWTASTPAAVHG